MTNTRLEHYTRNTSVSPIDYDEMREARRQVMAVTDTAAQDALFTLLGLIDRLTQELNRR